MGLGDADSLRGEAVVEQVRTTVERVIKILRDPNLQGEEKKAERREKLSEVILPRFDFEKMVKCSLGNHWPRLAGRREDLVHAFASFVENSYAEKIEAYKNEKILYLGGRLTLRFTEIDTKVITSTGEGIPISYKLRHVGGQWKVYDVLIENVSLVEHYRSQFRRILATETFDELLERLQGRGSIIEE